MFFECKLKKERYERRGRCGGGDDDDYGRRGHREQRCGRSGCRQKCAYSKKDGIKIYTSYCCDHACLLGAHRCQLMKEKGESYCHIHATCAAAGCLAKPERLSTKQLPWFCDRHECTYPGCASFAERGSRCAMHAGGSSSLFCSVGGCPGLCGPHSLFCEPHAAAERGGGGGGAMPMPMPMPMPGHNMAPSGGWNNAPHPPPPHAAAAGMMPGPFFEGGLGAFPAAQPGVHQCDAHCTEHRHSNKAAQPESFCRTPGCQRLRRATGDSEWCETHTCEVHACAQRRSDRHASMRTCERHACAVARCDRAAQPPGAFCRVHGCAADTCGRFRDADGGGGGSGGWFCAEHECRRPRCLERVAPGADFCPRHLADREEEEVVVERRRRRAPGEQRYGQQQQWRRRQTCGDGMAAPRVVIFQGDAGDGCGCGGGRQGGRRHRRDRSLSCGEDEDGCRCEGSCDRDGGMFRRVYHDE